MELHVNIKQVVEQDASNALKNNKLANGVADSENYDFSDLKALLQILMSEYSQMASSLVTPPAKGNHYTVSGYFSAEAECKLIFAARKIQLVAKELGSDKSEWIKKTHDKILRDNTISQEYQEEEIHKYLNSLKSRYSDLAKQLVTRKKKGKLHSVSGFYNSDAEAQLSSLAQKITTDANEAGVDLSAWVNEEQNRILSNEIVPFSQKLREIFIRVGIPAIILLITALGTGGYILSEPERNQFGKDLIIADALLAGNDYSGALNAYKTAQAKLGSLFSFSCSSTANERIHNTCNKALDKVTELSETEYYLEAMRLLAELNEYGIPASLSSKYAAISQQLEKAVNEKLEKGRNAVLSVISANRGKVTEECKAMIYNLLELSPDDYWLNLIKNKK